MQRVNTRTKPLSVLRASLALRNDSSEKARSRGSRKQNRLPVGHHRVVAMVAPRALLAVESSSTFFARSSHVSTFTSGSAARRIWESPGVPERTGMTQVSTNHCNLPASQRDEMETFVDRFLLDQEEVVTNVLEISAISVDPERWAPWETPGLE
jgi:hypothetical protein